MKVSTPKRNTIEVTSDGNELVIRLPIAQPPAPSASGKTLVVASTRGFFQSTATVDGKPISISVNATIKK